MTDLSESFRQANVRRCIAVWRKIDDWTTLEWAKHVREEAGELCEAVEAGKDGNTIMKEVADVYTYLDLLCERLKVTPFETWEHIIDKFNEVSRRVDYGRELIYDLDEQTLLEEPAPVAPCPFCGSKDVCLEAEIGDYARVNCNGCGAYGSWVSVESGDEVEFERVKARAVELWNQRAASTAGPTP